LKGWKKKAWGTEKLRTVMQMVVGGKNATTKVGGGGEKPIGLTRCLWENLKEEGSRNPRIWSQGIRKKQK